MSRYAAENAQLKAELERQTTGAIAEERVTMSRPYIMLTQRLQAAEAELQTRIDAVTQLHREMHQLEMEHDRQMQAMSLQMQQQREQFESRLSDTAKQVFTHPFINIHSP